MISRWRQPRFGISMPRPVGGDRPGLVATDKRRLQDLTASADVVSGTGVQALASLAGCLERAVFERRQTKHVKSH